MICFFIDKIVFFDFLGVFRCYVDVLIFKEFGIGVFSKFLIKFIFFFLWFFVFCYVFVNKLFLDF